MFYNLHCRGNTPAEANGRHNKPLLQKSLFSAAREHTRTTSPDSRLPSRRISSELGSSSLTAAMEIPPYTPSLAGTIARRRVQCKCTCAVASPAPAATTARMHDYHVQILLHLAPRQQASFVGMLILPCAYPLLFVAITHWLIGARSSSSLASSKLPPPHNRMSTSPQPLVAIPTYHCHYSHHCY